MNISTRTYYKNGTTGDNTNGFVGGASSSINYVVRYKFTTSSTQKASKVKMVVTPWGFVTDSGNMQQMRFYITKDSSSHANANASSTSYDYTGTLSGTVASYWVGSFNPKARLTSEVVGCSIEPDTTYYLWIFGSTATPGYYDFESGSYVPTVTLTLNP